jgi:hypothetical protein
VVRPTEPVLAPDGTRLADHDQRPTTDDSVFGSVRFGRHDCAAPGHDGRCPLAAALSGPARCSADLRREWAADGTTDASSWESQTVLERLPGVSRSLQAIETGVADAEGDVAAFDEQPVEATTPPTGGAILVVQADGTGVPRVQPSTVAPPVRLGKR